MLTRLLFKKGVSEARAPYSTVLCQNETVWNFDQEDS